MLLKKIFIGVLILCQSMSFAAYDSLVNNESYFKKEIEKSKVNNFGENRAIAIFDSGLMRILS